MIWDYNGKGEYNMVKFDWESVSSECGHVNHGSAQFFDFEYNKQPGDYLNLYSTNEDGYLTNTLLGGEFAEAKLRLVLADNPSENMVISDPQVLRCPPLLDEPSTDNTRDIQTVLIINKGGMEIALDLYGINEFEFTVKEGSGSDMTHTILYSKPDGSADIT